MSWWSWFLLDSLHNSKVIEVRLNARLLIWKKSMSSVLPQTSRPRGSLRALLAQLNFLFTKNGFCHTSLSLEQLLHQLLPSAAGPRCPQSSSLPQAERAEQPCIVQKSSFDKLMWKHRSRRTHFMGHKKHKKRNLSLQNILLFNFTLFNCQCRAYDSLEDCWEDFHPKN